MLAMSILPLQARLAAPGPQLAASRMAAHLPARLAAALCAAAGVPADRKAAELRKDERTRLLDALAAYPLRVSGDAGFAKAEVSGGGVPLSELRLDTLESRKAPGVFICGELVDAFGRIGGCVRHSPDPCALLTRVLSTAGSTSCSPGARGGWQAWGRRQGAAGRRRLSSRPAKPRLDTSRVLWSRSHALHQRITSPRPSFATSAGVHLPAPRSAGRVAACAPARAAGRDARASFEAR
jgi:hypothetical protein